jgi:hypothetical protein
VDVHLREQIEQAEKQVQAERQERYELFPSEQ